MKTTGNPRRTRTVLMVLAAAAASFPLAAMAQDVKPGADVKFPIPGVKPGTVDPAQVTAEAPFRFDAMAHNWGRVTDAAPLDHVFKFTNISNNTVTVKSVTATCGCTVPQLQQKTYAPGESGEIKVQFNPTNRKGDQSKQVNVTFEDPQYPQMRLDLSSHVLPMLWVEPNRVLFQDIYKGTGATQQVIVTSRNPAFEITSTEGQEQNFTAKVIKVEDGEDEGDPVRRITLEVALDKAAPIGTYNTQMAFKSNEPKWPEFKIFATAMVVGELKADPPSILVRTQQPNTPFEAMAILETRNSIPFDIESVDWTIEGNYDLNLVVDWEAYDSTRGRPTYLLRFSGVTPATSAQIRATIKVKSNIGATDTAAASTEEATIVLWGNVRGNDAPKVMAPATDMPGTNVKMPINPTSIAPTKPGTK